MVLKKNKFNSFIAASLCGIMTLSPGISAIASDMPTGGSVQNGNVEIAYVNPDHMVLNQNTHNSVIHWDSFSVHSSGVVDFNMPSSNSSSLNRVLGSTPSNIAGRVNSNGNVVLVNPNGVFLTKSGVVRSNSFTASSLDINTSDFLHGRHNFYKNKTTTGVENHGNIEVSDSGHASLLGKYVSNQGTITAKLGKIFMGAGEQITLDLSGNGLMKVAVPTSELSNIKDINGKSLDSLVTNNGSLIAEGGYIQLSAKIAENLMLGSVNVGSSGIVSTASINQRTGNVVIGGENNDIVEIQGNIDVSSKNPTTPSGRLTITGTNVYYGGSTNASGSSGGKILAKAKEVLVLDGSIVAKGLKESGGDLMVVSEDVLLSTARTNVDMSGSLNGGSIKLHGDNYNLVTGAFKADGNSNQGGIIDYAGQNVKLAAADISAKGASQGGKVRIGGEYLGGQDLSRVSLKEYNGFINRFENQNEIINSQNTIVDYDVNINISSAFGQGGTAVIWSDETTDFLGSIDANGYLKADEDWVTKTYNKKEKGGFIEISSKNLLRTVNLERVSVDYGTLLLDPKNITVDASGSSGGSLDNGLRAQVYYNYFNDSFNYFGTVGGRTQDSRSSVRNRFNRDFTTINHITPGRNFAERYSAEWRGFFKPKQTGTHRFYTFSDDSSWAWLFTQGYNNVDSWSRFISVRNSSNRLVDNRGAHGMRIRYSSNVTLQADTYYPLLIYFGERTGGDRIDFGWQGPGQGWTTNMSGVAFHNNDEFSSGSFTGASGSAGIETVNSFSTDSSSTNTVGSGTIQDLLAAGTDVYLRANQDITVSNAISVSGSSGGNLSLLAGRDITINSNITTANGDLTLRANTSTSYGVVDSQRGSGTADITNNATINAGSGTVTAVIDGGTGLTNDQPGNISLGTITAGAINATGDSATGTITGTSLTASNNSGTTIDISGYEMGAISSINTNGNNTNWRIKRLNKSSDNTFSGVESAEFIQYGYSNGDSISGSGSGILNGYDPGELTKTYGNVSGTSVKVKKVYDGTASTSSATFGTSTVTAANGLPSGVNVTLSNQTYTYNSGTTSDSAIVTADAAYTISSKTHSRHGDVYGLVASSTVKTINNAQITPKQISLSGSRNYNGTNIVSSTNLTVGNLIGDETLTLTGSASLSSANVQSESSLASTAGLSLSDGSNGGLASNYTLVGSNHKVTVNKKPIKLSGSRKINRINRNVRLTSGQLRMNNQIKGDNVKLSGSTKTRVTKEGLNKIGTNGLKLTGTDASNYTLLGETHEFLFELRAKFKAIKNIENKINELAKSGKKIITGATQAVPKVVAMTTAPSPSPAAGGPSLGGGPTGGGGASGGPSASGGASATGGSSGGASSGGGESGSEE